MKQFFSKKMVATLATGALIVTVAIAGISAWFTGAASTQSNRFETATVAVESTGTELWVNNFYPGDAATIAAQKELENSVALGGQSGKNQALSEWWYKYNDLDGSGVGSNFYIAGDDGDISEAHEDAVKFIVNPTAIQGNRAANVTPGSFVYNIYSFRNTSNIPVYLRVAMPEADVEAAGSVFQAAYIAWPSGEEYLLVDGDDGYFYCPVALEAVEDADDATEITIHFTAYFSGSNNGNDLQNAVISFEGVEDGIQIIQATNNAVYLADGWKDAGVDFVPYVGQE